MKKKVNKCDFGYLNYQCKKEIIMTILLFVISLGILFLGICINGTKNNLLTIVAVLGLLPASKELIIAIMFLRAKKYACSESFHEEILATGEYEKSKVIRYDLYMTAYQKNFPIYAMTCKAGELIGFSDVPDFDYEEATKHIMLLLSQNGFKNITVKIFDKKEKFLERLKAMSLSENENTGKDLEILHLMENISL